MIKDGAILHNLAQQRQSHSDAPPCGGACSGCFRFLAAGSQNARGTLAARAARKIPIRVRHKRTHFRSNSRLHGCPLRRDQRDGTLANNFMVIRRLNAKCRASCSQPFSPPSQLQRRSRWDRPLMLHLDGPTHHDFCFSIYMPLHLTDADGFDHCNQIPSRQAFDQPFRVVASMRKPEKQCPCRLLRRHTVGFFKEDFTDALMVHEDLGEGLSKFIRSGQSAQSGVTETALDPRADEPHDQPNQAFSSVAGLMPLAMAIAQPGQRWRGVRVCGLLEVKTRAANLPRAPRKNAPATRRGILLTRLRQRPGPVLPVHLLHPLLPAPPVLRALVPATSAAANPYPLPAALPRWPVRSS